MRISQIAPLVESIPPKKYGGTERVISALTEELVKRNHQVTLFASGDSHTRATLVSVCYNSLRNSSEKNIYRDNIWSLLNIEIAYSLQHHFDIIHDHNSQNNSVSLPLARELQVPVVMTLHGPLSEDRQIFFEKYSRPYFVTISKNQSKPAPYLHPIATIYNGLPMEKYPFGPTPGEYLLFVGRVHIQNDIEEKGLHHAIDIAEEIGMPLLIAAKIDMTINRDVEYFKTQIKPRLSDSIKWIGEVDERRRNNLMSHAYCLLHTVNFSEPFGLTLIEAMACGCPVMAFDKGSIPEIIEDNKTGFVVSRSKEACMAIKKILTIDRKYCRTYALQHFNAKKMTDEYENIYSQIIEEDRNNQNKIKRICNGHSSEGV